MLRRRVVLATLVVSIAGCATPAPSPAPVLVAASTATGEYRLDVTLAKQHWAVGEPMTGSASLSRAGNAPVNLVGAGSGLIVFDFDEVGGGQRHLTAASTADCAPHPLTPGTPLTAPLDKSGGYDAADPSQSWLGAVLHASGVQLPAGTWDVTARAEFTENACDGPRYHLEATVRVVVGG